jgi:hypothetical protein
VVDREEPRTPLLKQIVAASGGPGRRPGPAQIIDTTTTPPFEEIGAKGSGRRDGAAADEPAEQTLPVEQPAEAEERPFPPRGPARPAYWITEPDAREPRRTIHCS